MQSQTTLDAAPAGAAEYRAFALGQTAVLLVRDLPHRTKVLSPAMSAAGRPLSPATAMKLARADGGTRVVRILNRGPGGDLAARLSDGQVLPAVDLTSPPTTSCRSLHRPRWSMGWTRQPPHRLLPRG